MFSGEGEVCLVGKESAFSGKGSVFSWEGEVCLEGKGYVFRGER